MGIRSRIDSSACGNAIKILHPRKRRFCNYFSSRSPRAEMHIKIYISPLREYDLEPTVPLAQMQSKYCIPASQTFCNYFSSRPRLRKCTECCASPQAEMRSGCCISASRKCKRMCAVPLAVLHIKRSQKIVQIVALSRGFKFIPTPKTPHHSQILEGVHELARKMRMRYIMRNKRKKHHVFKLPSKWDPSTSHNTVLEEYLNETLYELSKIKRIKPKSNMSKAEKVALNELKNNKSIVIKPIDKGKACAIVSREQYTAEAQRQLSAFHYQKVDHDWTSETCTLVDDLVEDLFDNKIISKETREYLITSNRIINAVYTCLWRPINLNQKTR